tara:strand:+ start:321 stop:770 length:450 start_codon:yes stop_codon:yes gene_type:complete
MNKTNITKFFLILLTWCFLFTITGCENNSNSSKAQKTDSSQSSSNSSTKKKTKSNKSYSSSSTEKKTKSNNGTYKYETSDGSLTITISGSSWRSAHVITTGFGEAYDNQNAQYDRGIVNGDDLYDSSGYIKLGYVSGNRVNYAGYNLYK